MAFPVFRHAGLKVLSVLFGTLLWLLLSGEQLVERVMRVPLEFSNLSANLELVGDIPDAVDVRVRGSSGSLSRISPGDLAAMLNLSSARPGSRLVNVTTTDVRAPLGIEVIQVTPSSLLISFEPLASKLVPILPPIDGVPAPGFLIGRATSDPETVEVVGAQSALDEVTAATTEPVSVADASAPVTEPVNVGVANSAVRLRQPLSALVTVEVVAAPIEWTVEGVPVEIRNAGVDIDVSPASVTVYARGQAWAEKAEVSASVDVAGLQPGQHDVVVQIDTPPGVGVMRVEPPQLRVTVR